MKILIVEDERPIAKFIERCCKKILQDQEVLEIEIKHTLENASNYLFENQIDLCLLDLNLNGKDGFDLLKLVLSGSFHTVVVSANTDRAIEAFQFGVLDFVAKPFDERRLRTSFDRFFERVEINSTTKYLSVRKNNENVLLEIEEIYFFKAAGIYVEAHLKDGKVELLDKTMDRLGQILPSNFIRIHRSYFVEISEIESYKHVGGGTYCVNLKNGESLPLSRQKYKELHELFNH